MNNKICVTAPIKVAASGERNHSERGDSRFFFRAGCSPFRSVRKRTHIYRHEATCSSLFSLCFHAFICCSMDSCWCPLPWSFLS